MAPVFIVGSPRSGTSMLHWSLAQHSQLWGSAESDFLFEWVKGTNEAWAAGNVHGELHWLPVLKHPDWVMGICFRFITKTS